MTSPAPDVVFNQVEIGELAKLKRIFSCASPEDRQSYLDYLCPERKIGILDVALENLSDLDTSLAIFLIEQGARPKTPTRNSWGNVCRWMSPGLRVNSGVADDCGISLEPLWDALVALGLGREDLKGQCWGAAHRAAQMSGYDPVRALHQLSKLKDAGYGLDDVDEIDETPLMVACWMGCPEVIRYLASEGADLTARTKGSRSVLSFVFRGTAIVDKVFHQDRIGACLVELQKAGYPVEEELRAASFHENQDVRGEFAVGLAIFEAHLLQRDTQPSTSKRNTSRL